MFIRYLKPINHGSVNHGEGDRAARVWVQAERGGVGGEHLLVRSHAVGVVKVHRDRYTLVVQPAQCISRVGEQTRVERIAAPA